MKNLEPYLIFDPEGQIIVGVSYVLEQRKPTPL